MADFHVLAGVNSSAVPELRKIGITDVVDALREGFEDFWDKPSHYVFLCLIYPVAGIVLISWTSGDNALQMIYPLLSGFALLGPFFALGLYEISRRREQHEDTSWLHVFDVRKSPAIPAIIAVGALLVVMFVIWLYTAQALFSWLYGNSSPDTFSAFVKDVLTTSRGWTLILLGNAIGFLFALAVLSTTVVAFPLLLDRDVGASAAIQTSAKAVLMNPVPLLFWGFLVAVTLLVGILPLLVGLAIVLPVLGHSTWHLYRKLVSYPG